MLHPAKILPIPRLTLVTNSGLMSLGRCLAAVSFATASPDRVASSFILFQLPMKKASVVLSLLMLLAGGAATPASAHRLAASSSLTALYPDNDYFFAGLYGGQDFVAYAAATFGKGTDQYYEAIDAEIAYAEAGLSTSASGGDDWYYYSGYRTGLRQRR